MVYVCICVKNLLEESLNESNGRGLMWEGKGLNHRKGRGLYGKLGEQCKLLERRLERLG